MATIDRRTGQALERENRRRRNGILLASLAILAAIVLLAVNPSLLVALTSDREGQALFGASTLAPGGSVQGNLTLANEGLLPLDYKVNVSAGPEEAAAGTFMRIRNLSTGAWAYQGPITGRSIALGRLLPGQRVQIAVVLQAPPSQATSSIPINDTFTWTGRSPGVGYWWWLVLVAAVVAAAAFAGPRLLDLVARLRRLPPLPYELYWRVPLILAILLLACLVPLTGMSLSSVNAESQNPANTFAIGTLALSDKSPSGTTCISVPGPSGAPSVNSRCDAIFSLTKMAPGGSAGRGSVTIRNLGTVPVSQLLLWSDGCGTGDAAQVAAHGGGDLCPVVMMSIHDDTHNACVFPGSAAGECPLVPQAGTVGAFAAAHGQGQGLALSPQGLGAGITYTFSLALDPAAGNSDQGRALFTSFYWLIVSA